MSININSLEYATLNKYAVLATSGITTVNVTTITNGVYGTPGDTGITGTYIGLKDTINAAVAQTELTSLVDSINLVPISSYISDGNINIVEASNITNGKNIYQVKDCNNVEYYHLECNNHYAIYANGLLTESYFNANNKHKFDKIT